MEGRAEILKSDGLYHVYDSNAEDGNVVALRGLHVTVYEGEAVAVIGPSGSGKSTLLKCLGGLMKPSAGGVELAGRRMTRLTGNELVKLRQETISFIFQDSNLLPHMNALDNVALALELAGKSAIEAEELAIAALDRVGLSDRIDHIPDQLSGGQQQRVAIARAISGNRRLLLADEPTGNLDIASGDEVLKLFKELCHRKEDPLSILMVTHDPLLASQADRMLLMKDGKVAASDIRSAWGIGVKKNE